MAVIRRLPGRARPREEVLREYQESNAKVRRNIPAVLWDFLAPDPDQFYRWRVQLDCGCIKELLTLAWIHRSAIAVGVFLTRPGRGVPVLALREGSAAGGGG
jgi:hypothetical protein